MSIDGLTLRLTGDPGAMTVEAFTAAALKALGSVLRPLAKDAFTAPETTDVAQPRLTSCLPALTDPYMPEGHGVPCALPAALWCTQVGSDAPPDWFTHLLWPSPHGIATLPIARLVLDHQPGDAMIELSLMIQGLPLTDVSFTQSSAGQWSLADAHSSQTSNWDRWVSALEGLNVAMDGWTDRLWDVEGSGAFTHSDAQRLQALGQRLNAQI